MRSIFVLQNFLRIVNEERQMMLMTLMTFTSFGLIATEVNDVFVGLISVRSDKANSFSERAFV